MVIVATAVAVESATEVAVTVTLPAEGIPVGAVNVVFGLFPAPLAGLSVPHAEPPQAIVHVTPEEVPSLLTTADMFEEAPITMEPGAFAMVTVISLGLGPFPDPPQPTIKIPRATRPHTKMFLHKFIGCLPSSHCSHGYSSSPGEPRTRFGCGV